MKAKDKVLKIAPNVQCAVVKMFEADTPDYQIWLNKEPLSKMQPRESWAWAAALRNLISKSNPH